MHCAPYHFIKALGVPSQVTRTGKCKQSQKGAEDDDAEDGDVENVVDDEEDGDIDTSLDVNASSDDAEAMAETSNLDFEPGDTIGKILSFVNQVRMSSEDVRKYLAHSCRVHRDWHGYAKPRGKLMGFAGVGVRV